MFNLYDFAPRVRCLFVKLLHPAIRFKQPKNQLFILNLDSHFQAIKLFIDLSSSSHAHSSFQVLSSRRNCDYFFTIAFTNFHSLKSTLEHRVLATSQFSLDVSAAYSSPLIISPTLRLFNPCYSSSVFVIFLIILLIR